MNVQIDTLVNPLLALAANDDFYPVEKATHDWDGTPLVDADTYPIKISYYSPQYLPESNPMIKGAKPEYFGMVAMRGSKRCLHKNGFISELVKRYFKRFYKGKCFLPPLKNQSFWDTDLGIAFNQMGQKYGSPRMMAKDFFITRYPDNDGAEVFLNGEIYDITWESYQVIKSLNAQKNKLEISEKSKWLKSQQLANSGSFYAPLSMA